MKKVYNFLQKLRRWIHLNKVFFVQYVQKYFFEVFVRLSDTNCKSYGILFPLSEVLSSIVRMHAWTLDEVFSSLVITVYCEQLVKVF